MISPMKEITTSSKVDHISVISNLVSIPTAPSKESLESDKKLRRPRSIVKEFSLNTSTHGLPGIARSDSMHNRIFWIISFLSFTGIMLYFVTRAIMDYFGYPTQINVDIIREWPQYFPAVSICNISPFRLDRFFGAFLNFTIAHNLTNVTNLTTIPPYLAPYLANFITTTLNANESPEPYFYNLSSMLYKCTFNGRSCSTDNFITFTSASYGLCYTFNAKMQNADKNTVRYGNQYGGNGDLELELYVHSHQYVPYLWNSVGIVALVHDNTELPLIETNGFELAPGFKHKLGYTKKTTFLLPAPYTSCTDTVPEAMRIMFEKYYNNADYGYSETVCHQLCEQAYAYHICGCVNPLLWNARSIILPGTNTIITVPVCADNFTNPCYVTAVDTLLNSPTLLNEYCSNCSQQCSIIDFLIQNSASVTPLQWQMNGIKTFVENSTIPLPADWSTAWRTYIQNNYLILSVIRETTIVENSTQSAQISVVDLLSNIGGQTGLWIGISFLSFMEFGEMLYRLIRYQCYFIREKLRTKKQMMSS